MVKHEEKPKLGADGTGRASAVRAMMRVCGGLLAITLLAGTVMMGSRANADPVVGSAQATASVNVLAACTLSGGNNNFSATVSNGATVTTENTALFGATTPIKATCNDPNGLSIYAIGYSGNTDGNNKMVSSIGSSYDISTGTSGNDSYWSMKLTPVSGSYTPIIVGSTEDTQKTAETTNYSSWANIPASYAKVAYYTANTDMDDPSAGTTANGSSVTPAYQIHISSSQAAGSYTGKVKYTLIHPNTSSETLTLYDMVASMSKGKQSASDLQQAIVAPSAEVTVSPNSGVYEYNAAEFGPASDAASTHKIYYYRGILDSNGNVGQTYGSTGLADAYPNYVKLNDTCWRIVRTTGSGGVKMVYAGTYGDTTAGSCANAQQKAQTRYNGANLTMPYNLASTTKAGVDYTGLEQHNMHAIGYTYSTVAASTTAETELSTLLGASGSDTTTNTNSSIIKQYIEGNWYAGTMTDYTSMLEPAAGYCNDRSVYLGTNYSTRLSDDTKVIPYGTTGMQLYSYGSRARNLSKTQTPSLTCPRGQVDLYSTTTASGGNGQLAQPVALLTADEMSFAGSGSSTAANGSTYHAKSFLRSGSFFWLLSPSYRNTSGSANEILLYTNGALNNNLVNVTFGVRPVISLTSGTTITGGSGTATDPWTVAAPSS